MLYLNFHNHIILIKSNESSIIKKLEEEFDFFKVNEFKGSPSWEIILNFDKPILPPSMVAVKILEHAIIYKFGHIKYIDYFGEAICKQDDLQKRIELYSLNNDRLFEISYLTIHSILGQDLDQSGLCRLHALAVSLKNKNAVIMLPSKGGKSSLLKYLYENKEIKIISDDMPLCDTKGRLHSFPTKISLGVAPQEGSLSQLTWHEFKREFYPPKWVASLSKVKERIETAPEKNKNLLIAGYRLSSGQSILTKVPKWKMISPIFEHMIFGIGLPQIIELFLSFSFVDIFKLGNHFLIRILCAIKLIQNSKCYHFYMGPMVDQNARQVLELLYDQQDN